MSKKTVGCERCVRAGEQCMRCKDSPEHVALVEEGATVNVPASTLPHVVVIAARGRRFGAKDTADA